MTWPVIVGGKADKNPIAKKYFVEGIPATFLLDRDGKVVAKDLRGQDLDKEVARQMKAPLLAGGKKGESAAEKTARKAEDND